MNHYYNNQNGGQNYSKAGYNGNASGYKKPYNPNYKSGENKNSFSWDSFFPLDDKKPYIKRGGNKQPRDKNFKHSGKPNKAIEVNENEFPPL